MQEQGQDGSTPPIYQTRPQSWLRGLHATADLGYAGLFPPHPGQEEDSLSVRAVKYGFATESRVSAEAFSAKAVIEGFHSDEVFCKLDEMMNELFTRRSDRIPAIPTSTFRLPTRVTLNEAKRRSWFRDLANPNVPLHKLGKSVPHGAKGHDLLDLLHNNNVAIPRAVWFLRVFGANEVAGLRNKPSYNPTQYSIDWTNVVTTYMKKQLVDIALPSPPRAGLNIKQTFKGVLTDTETRDRWLSRFGYCLQLLRIFYAEGMVDKRTFLVWLVHQMLSCNLAQAGFVTRLADEYFSDLTESRALSRPFGDACLNKLHEILSSAPAQVCLNSTATLLRTLIQRACLAITDAFVSPRMWTAYASLLRDVLMSSAASHPSSQHTHQSKAAIQSDLLAKLSMIEFRNKQLLLSGLTTPTPTQMDSSIFDIKLLNSISSKTSIASITYFDCCLDEPEIFSTKLDILFTWSVTPHQFGDHRPFAAIALLDSWYMKQSDRAHRRNLVSPYDFLQDHLFDWLDHSPTASTQENIGSIAVLYGDLIERGLFCYSTYLQRLVARDEPGLSFTEDHGSHHRNFVRHIPISNSNAPSISQRRVLLHGVRARDVPEEAKERQIRLEIRGILPGLFGGKDSETSICPRMIVSNCHAFMTSAQFERHRTLKQWFLPVVQKYATSQQTGSDPSTFLQIYAISIELMALAKAFGCMAEASQVSLPAHPTFMTKQLILSVLRSIGSYEVVMAAVDHIYQYEDIWHCMDILAKLVVQLNATQKALKAQGHQSRLLFDLLRLDGRRYLSTAVVDEINADLIHITSALRPIAGQPERVPRSLSEISLLEGEFEPDFPSRLANGLWIKYRTSPEWGMVVWDNVLTSLCRKSSEDFTPEATRKYALQYGTFLWHVDQHLPAGLDEEVAQWFSDSGLQMLNFSPELWHTLSVVMVYLVARRAIRITTILTGLIFPAWHQGIPVTKEPENSVVVFIQAANKLCASLLLLRSSSDDTLPQDIRHIQSIESRQHLVYSESFLPILVAEHPVLICLENNLHLPESLRLKTKELRYMLCREEAFKRAVYWNLDLTREAFETSFVFTEFGGNYDGNNFVTGLKDILCSMEGTEAPQWLSPTQPILTPWRLATTSIHFQLILKELGRALSKQESRDQALVNLDKVSRELFHDRMTAEEAYYIGEVARGADDVVTEKLVSSGLRRTLEILLRSAPSEDSFTNCLSLANDVLRSVLHLIGPFSSHDDEPSLGLDQSIHEDLVSAVHDKTVAFDQITSSVYQRNKVLPAAVLLLQLLQFALKFRGTWTGKAVDDGISLSTLLFRLTVRFCAGCDEEVSIYPLFLDTLYYLLDEIPHDSKLAFDPFRYYPNIARSDISLDIPPEHRKQLASLSTQLSANASIADLVISSRDLQGNLIHFTPAVNRPWEWVEYLGESALAEAKDVPECAFKNSGSLSLEMFEAKITGDTATDENLDANVRIFEDGLSAESLFRRDWRETRITIHDRTTVHEFEAGKGNQTSINAERKIQSSTIGRQSPGITDSTLSELGDSESISTESSKIIPSVKRKLEATDDDEVEVLEGPILVGSGSKRVKAKDGTRGKAKKR